MRRMLKAFRAGLDAPGSDERSAFDYVWLILLGTGSFVVVALLFRILFMDSF
ncbi:hypothetical protein T8T21_07635 [Limimaricola variabilis]|nr:hypothetical protein [Limimaricola variabilis]WPY95978.1 hypothetical protein T8T21_07635 [Limimaricola variabilis]